jgi:hypothetical protein
MTEEQLNELGEALKQVVPFAEQKRRMPWHYTLWRPGSSDEVDAFVEWAACRLILANELSDTMLNAIHDALMRDQISLDRKTGKAIVAEVARRNTMKQSG